MQVFMDKFVAVTANLWPISAIELASANLDEDSGEYVFCISNFQHGFIHALIRCGVNLYD